MSRKYDLLAISLLIFSAVLLVWLGLFGPTNTSTWKDWQPLMAAVVALGGASIVYRGAMLAYRAAMAKVDLDRRLNDRSQVRQELGMFLRLDYALNVLRHEAEVLRNSIPNQTNSTATPIEVSGSWLVLKEPEALIESWNGLQSYPPSIAERLSTIRTFLYDLANFSNVLKDNEWQITAWGKVPAELMRVRFAAEELAKASIKTRENLVGAIQHARRRESQTYTPH
jgi:hypothetical protein